jgi:hypothetical protein
MARKSTTDSGEKPVSKIVGDYPERPYGDAVSDEHREVLKEAGYDVAKKTEGDPTLAPGA